MAIGTRRTDYCRGAGHFLPELVSGNSPERASGTRRTVCCCEGRGFAGLEFGGFCGVPLRVAINKSASYGVWWNRIGELLFGNTYTAWRCDNHRFISVQLGHQLQRHIRWHWRGRFVEVDRQPPENDVGVDAMADGDTGHRAAR